MLRDQAITGFILAGGASKRMGRDKAWLPIGGQPMIERVIERLRPWVDRLAIIGTLSSRSRFQALPVDDVVTDLVPGRGPLMGIYTGLMASDTPLNLFIACDMPHLEPRLLERLVRSYHDGIRVIASRSPDGALQPLPLLGHLSATRAVGALLNQGQAAVQALCCLPGASVVTTESVSEMRAFTNVNRPSDYDGACHDLADSS